MLGAIGTLIDHLRMLNNPLYLAERIAEKREREQQGKITGFIQIKRD